MRAKKGDVPAPGEMSFSRGRLLFEFAFALLVIVDVAVTTVISSACPGRNIGMDYPEVDLYVEASVDTDRSSVVFIS